MSYKTRASHGLTPKKRLIKRVRFRHDSGLRNRDQCKMMKYVGHKEVDHGEKSEGSFRGEARVAAPIGGWEKNLSFKGKINS